ncbi:MAG: Mrp/NBP35 family ATP-binding protein [Oscillospiraceae bacterium]|nr:Mrp/NBP35 family ATP-binding protein [Oscillospiraceae bacterium]MDD6146169.1 Mrp/NBP35 family ATP-binding protein [Oscillospiraceae bacterium]
MSSCSGNCSSCSSSSDCKDKDLHLKQNDYSHIKKIYAVVSGKGGVGKSSVTSMLAAAMQLKGQQTAILDADVTGPSIPKMFGVNGNAETDNTVIFPRETSLGIRLMSINLLLPQQDAPVVWRGPVISGVIQQFFTDVAWGDVDYMFVDMPPGTGDVPLTVFQSLKVDGIIVVTTPQDLVGLIVSKAIRMAEMMKIPVVGLVENMSYFTCPDCGKQHSIFGQSKTQEVADKFGIPLLAKLPIDPKTPELADKGAIELADTDPLLPVIEKLL